MFDFSYRFGPSSGGTKITIRGCNLGTSPEDFLGFTICSCDHLDSLEYHSPAKLVCTTQPWNGKKQNPGPIVLVTKSGGRGVSTVKFMFQGDPIVVKKDKGAVAKGKGSRDIIGFFFQSFWLWSNNCHLSCNACSRLTRTGRTWGLMKLSCKLSLVNSYVLFIHSKELWIKCFSCLSQMKVVKPIPKRIRINPLLNWKIFAKMFKVWKLFFHEQGSR